MEVEVIAEKTEAALYARLQKVLPFLISPRQCVLMVGLLASVVHS